jgi:hypothetical protein
MQTNRWRRVAYGVVIAVVIYLLLLIYTNRRPAGEVTSQKAATNDVLRPNE